MNDTESVIHLVGEEDDQPACWTTDDAPWGTEARITHNPDNVTCPAPECSPRPEFGWMQDGPGTFHRHADPCPVCELDKAGPGTTGGDTDG